MSLERTLPTTERQGDRAEKACIEHTFSHLEPLRFVDPQTPWQLFSTTKDDGSGTKRDTRDILEQRIRQLLPGDVPTRHITIQYSTYDKLQAIDDAIVQRGKELEREKHVSDTLVKHGTKIEASEDTLVTNKTTRRWRFAVRPHFDESSEIKDGMRVLTERHIYYGKEHEVDITALAELDPNFTREVLLDIYALTTIENMVTESIRERKIHEDEYAANSFLLHLDKDTAKRNAEMDMIIDFMKDMGQFGEESLEINSRLNTYRKDRSLLKNHIQHRATCPTDTEEDREAAQRALEVYDKLLVIEPITTTVTDHILSDPLAYIESTLVEREEEIQLSQDTVAFLDEWGYMQPYDRFPHALAAGMPAVYGIFEGIPQKRKEHWIQKVSATGALSTQRKEDVTGIIRVPGNKPLEKIIQITFIKLIQDNLRKAHAQEEQRQKESGLLPDDKRLDPNWLFVAKRIKAFNPILKSIEGDIRDDAERAEEDRADIAQKREAMNEFLAAEELDPKLITDLDERIPRNIHPIAREKIFRMAFDLLRLQSIYNVDPESPALDRAVQSLFGKEGHAALYCFRTVLEEKSEESATIQV